MSPTCRRACWLAGRRHPQHAQSGGEARGLRVSPSVFFASMATCRAERRLQYDLECQCFYLLRAEERASTAVAVLRALLQLPLLRGGQRGLIAGLVVTCLRLGSGTPCQTPLTYVCCVLLPGFFPHPRARGAHGAARCGAHPLSDLPGRSWSPAPVCGAAVRPRGSVGRGEIEACGLTSILSRYDLRPQVRLCTVCVFRCNCRSTSSAALTPGCGRGRWSIGGIEARNRGEIPKTSRPREKLPNLASDPKPR